MMREFFIPVTGFALFTALSVIAQWFMTYLPAKWFCDYGETPDEVYIRTKLKNKPAVTLLLGVLTGLSVAVCFLTQGLTARTAVMGFVMLILMLTAVSDVKFTIIPDQFVVLLGIFGLVLYISGGIRDKNLQAWLFPVLGAVLGGGFSLLLNAVGKMIYKTDALGFGDTKLLAVCGLICSLKLTVAVLFLSIVAAGVHFSWLLLSEKHKNKTEEAEDETRLQRPFGPYIAAAVTAALSLSPVVDRVITWYTGLFT